MRKKQQEIKKALTPIAQLKTFREQKTSVLRRGVAPSLSFNLSFPFTRVTLFLFVAVLVFAIIALLGFGMDNAVGYGIGSGLTAVGLHIFSSFFKWLRNIARYFKLPELFAFFSSGRPLEILLLFLFSLALAEGLNLGIPLAIAKWEKIHGMLFHYSTYPTFFGLFHRGIFTKIEFIGAWMVIFGLSWFGAKSFKKYIFYRRKNKIDKNGSEIHFKAPFCLWIGKSTGWLLSLNHGAGIAQNQDVVLSLPDAAQNILILGAIGSGKTTRAMHPLLAQLLDQESGGLIFDIKGDFKQAVLSFAEEANRNIRVIGIHGEPINLLSGLTPEVAASFLKSVFLLSGHGGAETFWIDTATELCRNSLGILSFVPEQYSLNGLYHYLFHRETRLAVDEKIKKLLTTSDPKEKRLLSTYWQYYQGIFDRFEEKIKAGVHATVAQVLAPFNHPELIDAFCSEKAGNVHLESVLEGEIYLVDLPLSKWGLGGKVVYSLIKLRFFNIMQQRTSRAEWNQDRPIFFMCDEYQEIVSANKDGLSDLNFWDKSRSSNTIGIISAQAISSFYAAIGNRDIANALLQNFRQKICFKTEDSTTLSYFDGLADKVEVQRKNISLTKGESQGRFGGGAQSSSSFTENIIFTEKPVLNAQLFRSLGAHQAIALLSIDGRSVDDVINTFAIYLEKS